MILPGKYYEKEKQNCCGCGACQAVCPTKSITMELDDEGFLYPKKSSLQCIHCNKCIAVCPMLNVIKNSDFEQKVYAAWARDYKTRLDASSGGLFETMAHLVIDGGGIVCGAAFDEHLKLKHFCVDNLENLKKLCKSKYIQSNTDGVFIKIKEYLFNGRKVLFVGTPCQAAGLRGYLGKEYENLIVFDFICHGVPSQDMFDKCIKYEEKKRGGKINSFTFRVKHGNVKEVHGYAYSIKTKGKVIRKKGLYYEFPYYFGFKKYIFFRPSCYSCPYSTPDRCSDITLADFWGVEKYVKNVDFYKGVSMVIINSQKGNKLFEKVKEKIIFYDSNIQTAIECNQCLSNSTPLPKVREAMFKDLNNIPFDSFIKKYLIPQKTIFHKFLYILPGFIRKKLVKLLPVIKRIKKRSGFFLIMLRYYMILCI